MDPSALRLWAWKIDNLSIRTGPESKKLLVIFEKYRGVMPGLVSFASSYLATSQRKRWQVLSAFDYTMREGVEAVVFVGGVSLGYPATAFPLPVFTGMLTGVTGSYPIYYDGNTMSIQLFLIASTCMLYLIAAGMLSKRIWDLQYYQF
ncbi:hypothetical protein BO85DRAFT_434871 [Aspergillus piperis CBS 112811]|uniref:Uncharacterized protein n=1 Tax=Aspergillus piperis CBS 112811 TaxID=1448313 RepID=A0A8G1VQN9_9EURO|nr:hypothetical protein BO85DRAFT_434871 [Aspergillus piperis CBS 112811]RAH62254.1 hypothetical protein BO85DRAFT_434871 [Aspergillus piperis CBS 112811]